MRDGWIVEVEAADGALLYACRVGDPFAAEEIVRKVFSIADARDVFAIRPIDSTRLDQLGVRAGEAKGPI